MSKIKNKLLTFGVVEALLVGGVAVAAPASAVAPACPFYTMSRAQSITGPIVLSCGGNLRTTRNVYVRVGCVGGQEIQAFVSTRGPILGFPRNTSRGPWRSASGSISSITAAGHYSDSGRTLRR